MFCAISIGHNPKNIISNSKYFLILFYFIYKTIIRLGKKS